MINSKARQHRSGGNMTSIKAISGGYRIVHKVKGEIVRDTKLKIDMHYLIEPMHPLKKKHRGRICKIESFILNDLNHPIKAKVRFEDNNRLGNVELDDLVDRNNIDI